MLAMPGPVALVGSGEYTAAMLDVERKLLDGRPPRYVQVPTAAAPEGADRLAYWVDLGRRQAARLGVAAVPLLVRDRSDANDPALAAQVSGAGLVYLSGGDPQYLTETLDGTPVWDAILGAWRGGAALAGCSAGAMALAGWVARVRRPGGTGRAGLGLLPQLQVIPHFDRYFGRVPDLLARVVLRTPDGVTTIGVDEETALVGGPEDFRVHGRRSVWVLGARQRHEVPAGSAVRFPLP